MAEALMPSGSRMAITVKLHVQPENEFRMFSIDASANFAALEQRVRELLQRENVRLFWIDSEGDSVVCGSDDEWEQARDTNQTPIRLVARPGKHAASEKKVYPFVPGDGCQGPLAGSRYLDLGGSYERQKRRSDDEMTVNLNSNSTSKKKTRNFHRLHKFFYRYSRLGRVDRIKARITLQSLTLEEVHESLSLSSHGASCLVSAARQGHLDVVRYLTGEARVDVEQRGTVQFEGDKVEGASALWSAAAAGFHDVVRYLVLDCKANVNGVTSTSSLRAACYGGRMQIVRFLVEHGADLEIANRHGYTWLMVACYRGRYTGCQVSFGEWSERESQNYQRERILGAVQPETSYLLRYKGAVPLARPVTPPNEKKCTFANVTLPGVQHITWNDFKMAFDKIFIEIKRGHQLATFDENIRRSFDSILVVCLRLISIFVRMRHSVEEDVVDDITTKVSDLVRLHPRGNSDRTLLHLACAKESSILVGIRASTFPCKETIRLLLGMGADSNAQDVEGNTPLCMIVQQYPANMEVVGLMLRHGALVDITNKDGLSAVEFLRKQPLANTAQDVPPFR